MAMRISHDLRQIFNTLYLFKNAQEWRRFDFKSQPKKDKNLEMLAVVQARLVETGHLRWPEVYLSPGMSASTVSHIKEVVTSHQGKIVTSPQKATHIISEPKQEADPSEDPDKEYLRTIDHHNKTNLVHWWYYPDSYDMWLPATEVEGEQPDPDPPHHGVWKVSPRFISDLEIFNEWMNELDYEIEEDENQEEEGKARGRGKGKKGSRKRNSEEEEDPARRDTKKPKTKGKKQNDDEEDIDVDGEDHEGKGRKGGSSNPSTPIGTGGGGGGSVAISGGSTPKDKKSNKKEDADANASGGGGASISGSAEGPFKIKISRDVMVCILQMIFSLSPFHFFSSFFLLSSFFSLLTSGTGEQLACHSHSYKQRFVLRDQARRRGWQEKGRRWRRGRKHGRGG